MPRGQSTRQPAMLTPNSASEESKVSLVCFVPAYTHRGMQDLGNVQRVVIASNGCVSKIMKAVSDLVAG